MSLLLNKYTSIDMEIAQILSKAENHVKPKHLVSLSQFFKPELKLLLEIESRDDEKKANKHSPRKFRKHQSK